MELLLPDEFLLKRIGEEAAEVFLDRIEAEACIELLDALDVFLAALEPLERPSDVERGLELCEVISLYERKWQVAKN